MRCRPHSVPLGACAAPLTREQGPRGWCRRARAGCSPWTTAWQRSKRGGRDVTRCRAVGRGAPDRKRVTTWVSAPRGAGESSGSVLFVGKESVGKRGLPAARRDWQRQGALWGDGGFLRGGRGGWDDGAGRSRPCQWVVKPRERPVWSAHGTWVVRAGAVGSVGRGTGEPVGAAGGRGGRRQARTGLGGRQAGWRVSAGPGKGSPQWAEGELFSATG